MNTLARSLAASPELFPLVHQTASDTVGLIRLTEADYDRASFLDGRLLTPSMLVRQVPWAELLRAVAGAGLEESPHFIFHIGHVGSTLISRLLGSHPAVFALREPGLLREIALHALLPELQPSLWNETHVEERLSTLLKLWSRRFHPEQMPLIKATSFVSELAADILKRPSHPRALLIYVPAEVYLATILGAANSPQESRALAELRLKRLHRRLGRETWRVAPMSLGEIVAMSWASEMLALSAAAEAAPERSLWLNFDDFLGDPAPKLQQAFRHFGVEISGTETEEILSGPELHRYSKAPEHAYDANLRREILNQARREHAAEIARGIRWLDDARLVDLNLAPPP